jgi:Ala-tRNA(Pro) deacylase
MPTSQLKEFLEKNEVAFDTISHAQAFTAQETAAAAHIAGKEMAKTVVVKIDGEFALVVLPAPDWVSIDRLRSVTGAKSVEIASEDEFREMFPDCEVGAMPPFGNLWGLTVFVDERLREDEQIAFNAGSHTEVMKLAYGDYERLVEPVVAKLSSR